MRTLNDIDTQRLRGDLDAAANAENAVILARFFQVRPGGYGEGDIFAGIKLSQLRAITKPYLGTEFDEGDWVDLLRSPIHEHRLACLVVMSERAKRAAAPEVTRIYRTYLSNTAHINNWDLVDVSCAPIVGGYLMERDRSPLDDLARSGVLWERRIAMVSTHHFIRARQTVDTYRIAKRLMGDGHDLIHKAVGWMLREAGKRVDANELRAFLDEWAPLLPRTALRYAIEHFDPAERRHYRAPT